MKIDTKPFEEKMKKSLAGLENEFGSVSAGRASAAVLDRVLVEYCGSNMPVNQVAGVKMPDPRTLVISPWASSILKNIEKAILASDIGITPQNDGKVIRLVFPQPTEERRKELAKKVEKFGEECKGCYVITVSSNNKPVLVHADKTPLTDPQELYSGCYGRAIINFYVYDTQGNKGISAGLNGIMKLYDGEPLGGGVVTDSDWDDGWEDEDDNDDLLG